MGWARIVASGFGTGFAPAAPGTAASAAAALAGWALLRWAPVGALPAAALAACALGWAALRARPVDGDPGWVTIDEVAGQFLALCAAADDWRHVAIAFALFRVLDIAKPGPVGWADRRDGAFWIMADDIAAGALAAAALAGGRWAGWV